MLLKKRKMRMKMEKKNNPKMGTLEDFKKMMEKKGKEEVFSSIAEALAKSFLTKPKK